MGKNNVKSVIISGASGSMGSAATGEMARRGYRVIMACRNPEKGEAARQRILQAQPSAALKVEKLRLDSAASIRDFAERMRDEPEICGLLNNAGVISRDFTLTEDGFEQTLAVNYLGPFLLTRLLMPLLQPCSNIVNMVSVTCGVAGFDREFFRKGKGDFHQLRTYASTKLALMYFSIALSRRCGHRVNVADPGIVNSNMISMGRWFDPLADIFFRPFCKSPLKGALPAVEALCAESGSRLYSSSGFREIPDRFLRQREDMEWLWEETENILQNL